MEEEKNELNQETPAQNQEERLETAGREEVQELQTKLATTKHDPLRVIEAALFLSNKPLTLADLAMTANNIRVNEAKRLVEQLKKEYDEHQSAVEIAFAPNGEIALQVRSQFLAPVARLSKQVEMTRKSSKMLGLIAKRGQMLQSELKKYFRGEIYAYVHELKELDYITAEKHGNTRLLKPTKKFHDTFQISATT
ncbi:SMC-Scp complex subunit ScpB [Candidatus Micrarchaeota archaeon]|nr:SMC-Scp complex subunit ScpB [Candidatus Micrarchaeota archaeon]